MAILAWIILIATPAWAVVDHGIFGELLGRYNRAGVVDYAGFKAEETRLDAYLEVLAGIDPDALERGEKFAFYVNAYNAWTIKLILNGYPGIRSIKEMGSLFKSPWKKKLARIHGKTVSLDHIEHDVLRPQFKDPRVHFVVNCASKGCPLLSEAPLTGIGLEARLDDAASRFINDPRFNRIEGNTLLASSIFKWFGEDFGDDIAGFFEKYATGELKSALAARKPQLTIKYLDYDWTLNGR